jgi:cyclohexyl-isocyanide hydratase
MTAEQTFSRTEPVQSLPPLQIAMVVYPKLTLLDLIGPQTALGLHGVTHLVAERLEPVISDSGIALIPTTTYEQCPTDLDVLFVPGGEGTAEAMEDGKLLAFLRNRAETARYVTSVCSGSLILAAAGVLQGYRATTHWTSLDVLSAFGVTAEAARVVRDRNRLTGGGVTAGIDFGLVLLAQLRGEPAARMTQLAMEYDPQPPFEAGSPASAGAETVALVRQFVAPVHARTMQIAKAWQAGSRTLSERTS